VRAACGSSSSSSSSRRYALLADDQVPAKGFVSLGCSRHTLQDNVVVAAFTVLVVKTRWRVAVLFGGGGGGGRADGRLPPVTAAAPAAAYCPLVPMLRSCSLIAAGLRSVAVISSLPCVGTACLCQLMSCADLYAWLASAYTWCC
jgi:hypothetical protein